MPITNFWSDAYPLPKPETDILIALAKKISWKRNRKLDLLKRIRRIATRKTFSVREKKLLKRIINKQKANGIEDVNEITENFPGKSIERCYEEYNKLL